MLTRKEYTDIINNDCFDGIALNIEKIISNVVYYTPAINTIIIVKEVYFEEELIGTSIIGSFTIEDDFSGYRSWLHTTLDKVDNLKFKELSFNGDTLYCTVTETLK